VAFDAINTFFTLYGKEYLHVNEATAAMKLTYFSLAMAVFAIPAGIIATKIGRKKAILIGLVCMCLMFIGMQLSHNINTIGYIFIVCGAAWAMININSYPMVLSMTSGAKVGRFTGYYYAFSCLAGIISPTLAGVFINWLGYPVLFVYSVTGFVLALVLLLFVKEPKSDRGVRPLPPQESGSEKVTAAGA
jgi:maltose/moltooligosaccharide transporter